MDLVRRLDKILDRYADGELPENSNQILDNWLAAALELADQCAGKRAAFDRVAREVGAEDLKEWIVDIGDVLARGGRVDSAIGLADAFAGAVPIVADEIRVRALVVAGRTADAVAAAANIETRHATNPYMLLLAARAFAGGGEQDRAGAAFENALKAAQDDPEMKLDVVEEYLPWAEQHGGRIRRFRLRRLTEELESDLQVMDQDDESEFETETDEDAAGDWVDEDEPEAEPVEQVIAQPKPGRNDPCPCGSGKKYKKCCGK